jgi:hypothetical protein
MTATINVYKLPQVVTLTMGGNTGAALMNYPMVRTDFKVTKGVKNEILFFIRNVDRKVVQLDGTPRAVIVDTRDNKLLLERDLTVYDAPKGIWMLSVSAVDAEFWPLGYLKYSVVFHRESDDENIALYTDRAYGPDSSIEVIQGPYPSPPEAQTVLLADMTEPQLNTMISGSYLGGASIGNVLGYHTFQWSVTNFIGKLIVQGSLEQQPAEQDSNWFDVSTTEFEVEAPGNGSIFVDKTGHYLWLRFKVVYDVMNTGTFEKVVFRPI